MVQLNATMEQTNEKQLAQLNDVLGFRRVIARYNVLSTIHETGPRTVTHSGQYYSCTLMDCDSQWTILLIHIDVTDSRQYC